MALLFRCIFAFSDLKDQWLVFQPTGVRLVLSFDADIFLITYWTHLGVCFLSKENLATARKPVEEVARNYDALQSIALNLDMWNIVFRSRPYKTPWICLKLCFIRAEREQTPNDFMFNHLSFIFHAMSRVAKKNPHFQAAKDMFNCLASAYFFGFLEGLHFSKSEEAALCAVGAQMLSLEEAAERLGRGSKPGDRQNDVAARLRMVAKEMWKMVWVGGVQGHCCVLNIKSLSRLHQCISVLTLAALKRRKKWRL